MKPEWRNWPETKQLIAAFPDGALRFVGGAVRDALLGRKVTDVDAATALLPQAVMDVLKKAGIKAIPTGIDHGTVTAVIGEKHFEITTLRRDTACDGRHAKVDYTDDWKEDAARRDFTMNALYLSPEAEFFDYFGGIADAEAGHVRFIGDAEQRIREDYLRILRFFRFHAWYGKGDADAEAVAACAKFASHMDNLSGERIQKEMLKLLAATGERTPVPFWTLNLMHDRKVIPHIVGFDVSNCALFSTIALIEQTANLTLPSFVKLAGFVLRADRDKKKALIIMTERLRLSNAVADALDIVISYSEALSQNMMLAQQKKYLRQLGREHFQWAVVMKWADGNEPIFADHPYHRMLQLAETWIPPHFPMTGDDLIASGIKPGKPMGILLRRLENEWENSDYQLTKEQLLAHARQ